MSETNMTTAEKRQKKIAQLKAKLQLEEARLAADARKERNGQLVAWGIYIEEFFKHADNESRAKLERSVREHLSGRNLTRALAGFTRLENEGSIE